ANKVGPLLPADRVEQFAAALGVPAQLLDGAGESQIVAPDGTVLAQAPRAGEAVVVADVDLASVAPVRRSRRRPELYTSLAEERTATPTPVEPGGVTVAALSSVDQFDRALAAGARLVVLPEFTEPPADLAEVAADVLVVSTALVDGAHVARLTLGGDLLGEQRQLHHTDRHPGVSVLGDRLDVVDTELGRVAMLVGDDVLYPELGRMAAIDGCHILTVSHAPTAEWEVRLGLPERGAENRVCVVAAAPPGPIGGTVLLSPPAASLWAPTPDEAYDGTINTPVAIEADGGAAIGPIHPDRALRREISRDTDVVGGRPWQRSAALVG
ncbi:MAG: nitrilase-related carbon-nitrogen hydrolase, partial [Ilumatobacteraceae bacterium]